MCGSNSAPIQMAMRQITAPHIARAKAMEKLRVSKESTPPVLRSLSSSGSSSNLSIRRGSGSARKQSVGSGRSRSKSQRFSTR
jgi:hypothetical protein